MVAKPSPAPAARETRKGALKAPTAGAKRPPLDPPPGGANPPPLDPRGWRCKYCGKARAELLPPGQRSIHTEAQPPVRVIVTGLEKAEKPNNARKKAG